LGLILAITLLRPLFRERLTTIESKHSTGLNSGPADGE